MLRRLCGQPLRSCQARAFSSTSPPHVEIRKLVKKAASTRDPREIKRLAKEAAINNSSRKGVEHIRRERQPESAYTRQHAASVLSKLTGEEVDMKKLGPLSNEDVKYFRMAPRPVLYTILGISENQLKDSLVVDTTVRRFLARGQSEKALMTARLAKDKGAVALNNIMKAYLEEGKVNDAIDLYTWRKKWAVPVTDRTLTVLFDGCANVRRGGVGAGLSTNQVKKLIRILVSLKRTKDLVPNMIHINSAFSAFMNCADQMPAFELLETWHTGEEVFFKPFKPTAQTYTIILKNLYLSGDDKWCFKIGGALLERAMKLPESKKDRELYEAFVFTYLKQSTPEAASAAFKMVPRFFQLDFKAPNVPSVGKLVTKVPELDQKFIPSVGLVDALVSKCNHLDASDIALSISRNFLETYPKSVDLPFVHRHLQTLAQCNEKNPGEQAVALYNSIKDSRKTTPTHITRLRVFLAIYRESLKHLSLDGRLAIGKDNKHVYTMASDFLVSVQKDITAYEIYGFLKAIRRVALTADQRQDVLAKINKAKFRLEKERETPAFKHDREHKRLVKKILETKNIIKAKHDSRATTNLLEKLEGASPEKFRKKEKIMLSRMTKREAGAITEKDISTLSEKVGKGHEHFKTRRA